MVGCGWMGLHVFVADVIMPLDLANWRILDRILHELGLPGWFC